MREKIHETEHGTIVQIEGHTMIPVTYLARALEVEYRWDAATRSVTFLVTEAEPMTDLDNLQE